MSLASLLLLATLIGMSSCHRCGVRCPAPWMPFGGSCYAYIEHPLPWIDAASLCRILSGNLVEINSAVENNFVQSILSATGANHAWLGINDIEQNGRWVLTSNGRPLSYTNWAPGEPNNYGGKQGCALMYKNGQWDDNFCLISTAFTFVCEKRRVCK